MKSMSSVGIIGGAYGPKQLYVGSSYGLICRAVGVIMVFCFITTLVIWFVKKLHQ